MEIAPNELDQATIERISALPEHFALANFWLMVRNGADRPALLQIYTKVVMARPANWNRAAIRREHEQHGHNAILTLDARRCFACDDTQKNLYFHHIIEIQNGGSNHTRNLVPICFPCHQALHPWLTEEPPRRVQGFESLYQIARRMGARFR